ncbi:hypothetical protein [Enterococcus italicus]|nr:hypothetical protein [Enterococcus italicus]
MKKSKLIILMLSIAYMVILTSCKQTNDPIITADKVDKVVILVKSENEKDRSWEAEDQNFLKALIENINATLGEKDENTQNFDIELTPDQKKYDYKIDFYNNGEVVQEVEISQVNKLKIDKEEYTIKEDREKELNSLKNHVLSVVR